MSGIDVANALRTWTRTGTNFTERAALVQAQRNMQHNMLMKEAAESGVLISDVLGARAMLGTTSLKDVPAAAVSDAMRAARAVQRRDVAVLLMGKPQGLGSHLSLTQELMARGAEPRILDARRMKFSGDTLLYRGPDPDDAYMPIAIPQAIIPRGAAGRVVEQLEAAGAHVVNRSQTKAVTLDKSLQAELFAQAGVPHPETIPHVTSWDDLRMAVDHFGFPAVVKNNNGHGGNGTWIARDAEGLEKIASRKFHKDGMLAQEYIEMGSSDYRYTTMRNVHGDVDLVSVHKRIGENGNANSGNSEYVRVPLDEVDPVRRRAAIDATEASGLDYGGVDIAETSRPVVVEINGTGGIPEHDLPLPYAEHSIPKLADWAVWGQRL